MNFAELRKAIDTDIAPTLGEKGFRRIKEGFWYRIRGDELNAVQLQARSSNDYFCINLGVHYSFVPSLGTNTLPQDRPLQPSECEIRLRLTDSDLARDQWWPIAPDAVQTASGIMKGRGLQIFDAYRIDGPISLLDGRSVEQETPLLLKSLGKARACLLIARLQEHLGNAQSCREAAATGLKLAGAAVGPRVELQNMLKRLGSP